jgi:conjugative transfer signal peptidase TraF
VYWALGRPVQKGDLVFVDPPASPIFELARSRGYLSAGYTPAGSCPLIKRVTGVPGDRVTMNAEGATVNGTRLANSAPRDRDGAGRPLQPYMVTGHVIGSGEVLLMCEYSSLSFDSRYFGPLSKTTIQSVIVPILTWK